MKNILLIGLGGTGSSTVELLYRKIREVGSMTDNHVTALAMDTDAGNLTKVTSVPSVSLADSAGVGAVCDRVGKQYLADWFPLSDPSVLAQEMTQGAAQWRKKSYLAFLNMMNKQLPRSVFLSALETMAADPAAACEVYIVASIAGGTGAGAFIPLAMFVKRYLKEQLNRDVTVNAMVALPDIYAEAQSTENRTKIYANAYAIFRELNAINLVANGYNRNLGAAGNGKKKAPIRFRIGSRNEPNVGLLFDAEDRTFWTPERMPFHQIFLLDRLHGLRSIPAHETVLANSLYTILCTDVGRQFDTENSNHATLRSQSNGSNAIYATVSTSQLRFPRDTILEYLAHKKTLQTCTEEWLELHDAVEKTIREEELRRKEMHRPMTLEDGEYAKILLRELENLRALPDFNPTVELVDRGTAKYDQHSKKPIGDTAQDFCRSLDRQVQQRFDENPELRRALEGLNDLRAVSRARLFGNDPDPRDAVADNARVYRRVLEEYTAVAAEVVPGLANILCDAVLPMQPHKNPDASPALSLSRNLLMQDGRYLHPVAATVQLCRFKSWLCQRIALLEGRVQECQQTPFGKPRTDKERRRSLYLRLPGEKGALNAAGQPAESPLEVLVREADYYRHHRTDALLDWKYLHADAEDALENLRALSSARMQLRLYRRLSRYTDSLIEQYQRFFTKFEKEKEKLESATQNLLHRDYGEMESVTYIYSAPADKERIWEDISRNTTDSRESLRSTDHVAGRGVFDMAYRTAVSRVNDENEDRARRSSVYQTLFDDMIAQNREIIAASGRYKEYEEWNVLRAMEESCRHARGEGNLRDRMQQIFLKAAELSRPSLIINRSSDVPDAVQPSDATVVILSENTASYIRKRAEEYGLPNAYDIGERQQILTCTEEFVRRYSGMTGVRVAIMDGIPDDAIYFTGEVMDIVPLRISKFDELGGERAYYAAYCQALHNCEQYHSDMWNPHLGFDLHKRGHLPYMNERMEALCDKRMAKALFYALERGELCAEGGEFRYTALDGTHEKVLYDGKPVKEKSLSALIGWLRNQDLLIEEWSALFDRAIDEQKASLPNAVTAAEMIALKGAMSRLPFLRFLQSGFALGKGKTGSIFAFAYDLKRSEEATRDCSDAERILREAWEVFREICAERIPPDIRMNDFTDLYRQQLGNLLQEFARSDAVKSMDAFRTVIKWVNGAGAFLDVPKDEKSVDRNHHLLINQPLDLAEFSSLFSALRKKAKAVKDALSGDAPQDAADAPDESPETDA